MKYSIWFCLILIGFSFTADAQNRLSDALTEQFINNETVDCIIIMEDQLDLYGDTEGWSKNRKANFVFDRLKSHALASQKRIKDYLESSGISHQAFFVFNGFQAQLTFDQANEVIEKFDIQKIVYNVTTRVLPTKSSQSSGSSRVDAEWGIMKIKADSVWQMGYRGEGVVVAGQDTGYDFDNGLILPKYRGYEDSLTVDHNYNWHDAIDTLNALNMDTIVDPNPNPCGFLSEFPCDDHGHGSHTMGTMVGSDTLNEIGVAPAASWIGCRNMDRGAGKPSTYTECFEWFLAPTDLEGQNPDPSKAPHVINNSWACPPSEGCNPDNWSFMETVINNLSAAGTVVVVSAGNDGNGGCSTIRNPAAIFENSFSVGATRPNDSKAGFSSIGPVLVDSSGRLKPDVVAPGFQVRSIWLDNEFNTINGTSMAGPHVAGAVALLINAKPSLAGQVDEIKDLLRSTAVQLIDSTECEGNTALESPNFYYGYGRIDVLAAVKKALEVTDVVEIENKKQIIHVYPNPNDGEFLISSISDQSLGDVYIRDVSGKIVQYHPREKDRKVLLIRDLSAGIYIYSVQNENLIQSGKVIVIKQ